MEIIKPYAFLPLNYNTISQHSIVLDLDHTLIATYNINNVEIQDIIMTNMIYYPIRSRIYHINACDMDENHITKPGIGTNCYLWGIARPYYREFLQFCFQYFKYVIVWSAGKDSYVQQIVKFLFKGLPMPHAIFTYNDLIVNGNYTVIKSLSYITERLTINLENLLALDDNIKTFSDNINNGILIPGYPEYKNLNELNQCDDYLLQLMTWFMQKEVIFSQDVRTLNKDNIFQPCQLPFTPFYND